MTTLVQEGHEQIKTMQQLNLFFGSRSTSLHIVSIGFGYGGLEQYFHEQTGSHVHIYDSCEENCKRAQQFVQNGKPSAFSVHTTIPCGIEGTICVKGDDEKISCSILTDPQIDICKIDMKNKTEFILYQLLHAGYRPGLFYIRWDRHPDKFADAMICAGHLQQCGYILQAATGPWFVYRFVDDCAYEYCSWARTDCANPLFQTYEEIIRTRILALK